MNARKILTLTITAFLTLSFSAVATAQSISQGKGDLRVMTYNADEGTDYLEVEQAHNQLEFVIAVGQTITQVRATNPPARMQALAAQIIAAAPTLVSLQELDRWYSGPFVGQPGSCAPVAPEFDMIQDLMNALAAQGGHYQIAVQVQQFAFPPTPGLLLATGTIQCVAVVNYNAILVRTDLDPSLFQWSGPQSALFVNTVSLPTPLGLIPIPRAWASVDVVFHKHAFRFIGTHLEVVPSVRQLQAAELRSGPANTPLPVVVAMDSNAPAFPFPQDPAYVDFITAGYQDAWTQVFPSDPGYTCCQAQFDNNAVSQLSMRIDLILTLGNIQAQNIALFGADPSSMTTGGLWPSDHAGVAAQLVVQAP
jgi:hypothetical protein